MTDIKLELKELQTPKPFIEAASWREGICRDPLKGVGRVVEDLG